MSNFKDLTGQQFGNWLVIKFMGVDKYKKATWLCECQCEDKTKNIIPTGSLKSGNSTNCGCLRKKNLYKLNKKYNTYNLNGEYGIGYTSKGDEFYFDLEDYDKIKDYCWRYDNEGYLITTLNSKYNLRMHRLIMDCPDDMEVDHIYHVNHDNRKNELRIVTGSQNQMNRNLQSNNFSGVSGVHWDNKQKKWMVQININHKRTTLGVFDDFDEAVKIRKQAEEKYYGEFAFKEKLLKV